MYSIELMELVNKERVRPLSKYEYRKRLKLLRNEKPDLCSSYTPKKSHGIRYTIIDDKYVASNRENGRKKT